MVLPLKPVTSPTPSSSQQSPKVQPLPGLEGGGGAALGCGSAMGGGRPFPQELQVGASRGVLGKVKSKLTCAKEVMSKLVGGGHFLRALPGYALLLARGTKVRWSHPSP